MATLWDMLMTGNGAPWGPTAYTPPQNPVFQRYYGSPEQWNAATGGSFAKELSADAAQRMPAIAAQSTALANKAGLDAKTKANMLGNENAMASQGLASVEANADQRAMEGANAAARADNTDQLAVNKAQSQDYWNEQAQRSQFANNSIDALGKLLGYFTGGAAVAPMQDAALASDKKKLDQAQQAIDALGGGY